MNIYEELLNSIINNTAGYRLEASPEIDMFEYCTHECPDISKLISTYNSEHTDENGLYLANIYFEKFVLSRMRNLSNKYVIYSIDEPYNFLFFDTADKFIEKLKETNVYEKLFVYFKLNSIELDKLFT